MSEEFAGRRPPRVAMLVSRFPKVTETFQLREMVALEKMGVPISLYAITHHQDEGTVQVEARSLDARANYFPRFSLEILRAQLVWLRRNPSAYLEAWRWGIRSNLMAPDFLLRTFLLVPLAAAMALRMEREGIEHIHAHFATYPTHAALVIHQLTGIPFSFTGHAHDIQVRQDGIGAKIEACEFFVCCTHHSKEQLRLRYGSIVDDKCFVVHHGIDIDQFTYREPNPDDGDRPIRICCVATFEEFKGHTYLIEAARLLAERGVTVDIALIGGDPPKSSTLQQEIRDQVHAAGLDDCVRFLGKVPSAEVREWIEWSDIGALACCVSPDGQLDGLPNFLTESLSMGRPVVSTRQEGVMELVVDGENGLLARSRDAAGLADAIERLHRDPALRTKMGLAGHETVVRDHDVTVNTRELYRIYMNEVGRPA
ncbi:MAG: glycosyltransferase family 4 protein [Acidimicrobiales bacterium]